MSNPGFQSLGSNPAFESLGWMGPFDDGAIGLDVRVCHPDGTVHVAMFPPHHRAEYDGDERLASEVLVLDPEQARGLVALLAQAAEKAETAAEAAEETATYDCMDMDRIREMHEAGATDEAIAQEVEWPLGDVRSLIRMLHEDDDADATKGVVVDWE